MTKSRRIYRRQHERKRYQFRITYDWLYDVVLELLAEYDPIGIALCVDEYEPEVSTILPRLGEAQTSKELAAIIHEEFERWFSPNMAGSSEDYLLLAKDIWEAYLLWASGWWSDCWSVSGFPSHRGRGG